MTATDGRDEHESVDRPRRPYESPVLHVYGSVATLTQKIGMNGTTADGGGGGMSKTS